MLSLHMYMYMYDKYTGQPTCNTTVHLYVMCVCVCISTVVFNNMQQQDAHEFLNYLLNTVGDLLAGQYHNSYVSSHVIVM